MSVRPVLVVLALCCSILGFGASASAERDRTPRFESGGTAIYEADLRLPREGGGKPFVGIPPHREISRDAAKGFLMSSGGDDIVVASAPDIVSTSMDIASNGDIYVAVCSSSDETVQIDLRLYRSTDGGDTWSQWGSLVDGAFHRDVTVLIVEGDTSRCYLAYARSATDAVGSYEVRVKGVDLSDTVADLTGAQTAFQSAGVDFRFPKLVSDVVDFSDYFLYIVADGQSPSTGDDIWFTRSLDAGASWQAEYKIADAVDGTYHYREVDLAYGSGGRVFVAFSLDSLGAGFPNSIRYRRATGYAAAGLAAWEPFMTISPGGDVFLESRPQICVNGTNPDELLLTYDVIDVLTSGVATLVGHGRRLSVDGGVSWDAAEEIDMIAQATVDLVSHPTTGRWTLLRRTQNPTLHHSLTGAGDDWVWEEGQFFYDSSEDADSGVQGLSIAFDPAHGNQLANSWGLRSGTEDDRVVFDAEWRSGAGYPQIEDGFPVALPTLPDSPPALVDLNGDGQLETVFSLSSGEVWAVQPDGTPLPGWPVDPTVGSGGPVAIGDLNGDGELTVVVGDAFGSVWAYDPEGRLLDGFPFAMPEIAPVFVSIGALGGPYPRTIVAAGGHELRFINYRGTAPLETFGWSFSGDPIVHPFAIGDIDGDGVAEAVGARGSSVFGVRLYDSNLVLSRSLGSNVSAAVTLGDVDGDGVEEICVPTENGTLYLIEGDGTDFGPGWPFVSSAGSPLSSVAMAQMRGDAELELVFAERSWAVHTLYTNGVEAGGFPTYTGLGWFLNGMPVVGVLEGTSPDVLIGSRDDRGWAWDNFGSRVPGWPRDFGAKVNQSPAFGDVDLDGRLEVAFVTDDALILADIATAPDGVAARQWPMHGHDPQRTGCADCSEDVVTAVDDAPRATHVSFAAPSPNPMNHSTMFRYSVPSTARVALDVYDLRGRRVRALVETNVSAGAHAIAFDGRDQHGRELASGNYFARLRVQAADFDETRTQKITLVR